MTTKTIAYPAIVIHHSTLEDMLTRGPFGRDPDIPIYLDRYDRNSHNHSLITHAVIVCVRAYNPSAGAIHSYTPYRAGTTRHFGEDTQRLDELWAAAGVILADLDATLSQTRQVCRGIIRGPSGRGPVEPVAGQPWQINSH